MAYSNFQRNKATPSMSSRKSNPVTMNFAGGIKTYKPNDTMDSSEIRLAQDARFDRVGEYGTRLGYKQLTTPIGYEMFKTNKSTNTTLGDLEDAVMPSLTLEQYANLFSVKIKLKPKHVGIHIVAKLDILSGNEVIATSCVKLSSNFAQVKEFVFTDLPQLFTSQTITLRLTEQNGVSTEVEVERNRQDGSMVYEIYTAERGKVTNVFEANIDGAKTVLFVFNEKLYRCDADGSNITLIRTLPTGTKNVRFCQNINQIRYVDGLEVPHILDPADDWSDTAMSVKDLKTDTPMDVKMSNIMNGTSDNMIYFDAEVDTKAFWTYPYGYTFAKTARLATTATVSGEIGTTLTIARSTLTPNDPEVGDWIQGQGTGTGEVTAVTSTNITVKIVDTTPQTISSYDKFSTDFYQNFPAIKTGDPLTAMFNLGGVLYFMTRRNKYQMYSQSADSWSQSNTNAQNGTFSQESLVCDLNYVYFANENGIYIFDGASEASITENSIQNVYDNIKGKDSIVLDMYKNRLYVYYSSEGNGINDHCLVYNINLRLWESFDSNANVSATSARQNTSGRFLCGHSKMGVIMLNEDTDSNDYSDMGKPIAFNLETSYQAFGATNQLKRITKWRPEFACADGYTVECGYALDYTDDVNYAFSIDLKDRNTYKLNYVWDNPSDYGVPAIPTRHTTIPQVNGEFYRIQIRYQHIAACEPVIFRSHTLTIQTQRIR